MAATPGQERGIGTSEFWAFAGSVTAALVAALAAEDHTVKIVATVALALLGSVLGASYIISRGRLKQTWQEDDNTSTPPPQSPSP